MFEALAERSFFLKTMPHMVQPIEFYFPVYASDRIGRFKLGLGLWLYDLLSVFRTPGFHRSLSARDFSARIPELAKEGLKGGFCYFDATMWDDLMVIETLRSAHHQGARIANYVEAIAPIWKENRIRGFLVRDVSSEGDQREVELSAKQVIICAGPWTDELGKRLSVKWKNWLKPSSGIHLMFHQDRIPVPGAVVMSHPQDGRISFVIPRKNYGEGMVIVGTTDAPSPRNPEDAQIQQNDIDYLLALLNRYFPNQNLSREDIVSAYIGVRPLYSGLDDPGGESKDLKSVSREHHIETGPGGVTLVAGGKYTTHRTMAKEIMDWTLKSWQKEARKGRAPAIPQGLGPSTTRTPVNSKITAPAIRQCIRECEARGYQVPSSLLALYGAEVLDLLEIQKTAGATDGFQSSSDPAGFPLLESQLRFSIRNQMVVHLTDFYFRRVPLYFSRKDHGEPWIDRLAQIWAEEHGFGSSEAPAEATRLRQEIRRWNHWQKTPST